MYVLVVTGSALHLALMGNISVLAKSGQYKIINLVKS